MTKDNHSEALAGGNENVLSTDGGNGNAFEVVGESAPLHEVLNEALGTTYKSPEDAVKGIKDTRDYVGKAGKYAKAVEAVAKAKGVTEDDAVKYIMETVQNPVIPEKVAAPEAKAPEVDTSKFVSRAEFEKEMFYKDNPALSSYKDIIDPLVTSMGKSHTEVVQMESVKGLLDAKKSYDDSEKSKSVLTSSSKLGQVTDKITQAREAQKAGNMPAASDAAVKAVREAFEF